MSRLGQSTRFIACSPLPRSPTRPLVQQDRQARYRQGVPSMGLLQEKVKLENEPTIPAVSQGKAWSLLSLEQMKTSLRSQEEALGRRSAS